MLDKSGANTRETAGTLSMVRRFIDDESGATAIEYGLITALVSVACIVTLQTLGDAIIETIETVAAGLSS